MKLGGIGALLVALLDVLVPSARPSRTLDAHLSAVWSGESYVFVWTQEHARDVVLIGSGSDKKATALRGELARLGRSLADVRYVLLPCGHAAMTAGLSALPQVPVGAAMSEAPLIWGQQSPGATLQRLRLRLRGRPHIEPSIEPLVPGETLTLGEQTLSVVALGDHTAGSLGFVVGNTLVVGESLDTTTYASQASFALLGFDEQPRSADAQRRALLQQLDELGLLSQVERIVDARHADSFALLGWKT